MKGWFAKLRCRSLAAHSAVLAGAVLVVYAVVAPVAGRHGGWMGLAAAAAAAAFCLLGAGLALVACRGLRQPKYALHGVLVGMVVRMGVPLVLALVFQVRGGPLAEAGLLLYLIVFYPVTLSVETALSLPLDLSPPRRFR
jgi:predicted Na+-dependent transporter